MSHRTLPEGFVSASSTIPGDVARRIRLVVFDVDGVLTDAGVYIGSSDDESVELKRFDIQDGLGMKLLEYDDLKVVWISGRKSPATKRRADELSIECHQDSGARKFAILKGILEREGLGWNEVAMLADDLPDMAIFTEVGLPGAVGNACQEILDVAQWVSGHRGGHGAARQFCEALLKARGSWDSVVERYVDSRRQATFDGDTPGAAGSKAGGASDV